MSIYDKLIIIRTAEIFLKKKNRSFFENILAANIKDAVAGTDAKLRIMRHRMAVYGYAEAAEYDIIRRLTDVPGIHSVSPVYECATDIDAITELCAALYNGFKTFRITVNRADKTFMGSSLNICRAVADSLLTRFQLKVDLHNPEANINIDVRENKRTYVFFETFPGPGGMPVGSAGSGLALLSGGLDSPVSSYLMSKRGLKLKFLHFHSFPYTSEGAKEKVISLANAVSRYNGRSQVLIVSVTRIQEAIRDNCPESYAITILRRFMMRIAKLLASENGCMALITGESLGQVASQTIESINVTNAVADIPVFRPLIAYDKEDIIVIAKKIGTFDISIQPYEDCCTVFLPKNPQTRPTLARVEAEEAKLNIEDLIASALSTLEVVEVG